MDQWRERLALFLGMPSEEIGQVSGGKKRVTGSIDIGLIQSLNRKGEVKDMVAMAKSLLMNATTSPLLPLNRF
jgi:superfamily II DNA or RNA helicase